jgi:pyruvate/2-oxoglutarate dehydrogenase complex dihydrolipoamide acyltransferase (E2) component
MLTFLVKAAVHALQKFWTFNASLNSGAIIIKKYYHIGFAADTPQGLVVPVIRDADRKSLNEIATEASALAGRPREGKLRPQDMAGGSFSISSLGGVGGTGFTPIIHAPEVAILGAAKAEMRASVGRIKLPAEADDAAVPFVGSPRGGRCQRGALSRRACGKPRRYPASASLITKARDPRS